MNICADTEQILSAFNAVDFLGRKLFYLTDHWKKIQARSVDICGVLFSVALTNLDCVQVADCKV